MKSLVIATAFAFATMTSVGMAGERAPQKLTEAQMDQVTAGQVDVGNVGLLVVEVGDVSVLEEANVMVAVPVNAAVAAAANVLTIDSTAAAAAGATQVGRFTQQ